MSHERACRGRGTLEVSPIECDKSTRRTYKEFNRRVRNVIDRRIGSIDQSAILLNGAFFLGKWAKTPMSLALSIGSFFAPPLCMTVDSAPISSLGISAFAAAIDDRSIGRGRNRWTAQVVGVHASPKEVWVQVARRSRRSAAPASVVLRLSRRATTAHALAALENAGSPASYPHVINVMRAL